MYKPNGMVAKELDPVMLLNIWAHHLNQETDRSQKKEMIFAGIGKPSYFINDVFARTAATYWQELVNKNSITSNFIAGNSFSQEQICNEIVSADTAVDYGPPEGTLSARNMMALALREWYGPDINIDPEEIIFTVGASSALRMLFRVINASKTPSRIITTLPYYSFYNNPAHHNTLHFAQVMDEPGCHLTADTLERSIKSALKLAENDGWNIGAFLFCDPNNPLGTVIGEERWKEIAVVLKSTPQNIPIILDEAYAELNFHSKHISLLKVAPELKQRIIVIRSATKGFSVSGERIAVVLCFNEIWRDKLIQETVFSYAHAPKSLQYAYAKAMSDFSEEKRLALAEHYRFQVDYVQKRVKQLNAHLPDCNHEIAGAFYVIANLGELLGTPIPTSAERALGKSGPIATDNDICYSLLFSDQLMIAPLSYFGVDPHLGYVRITCGAGISQLKNLMDRLENRIIIARASMKNLE